jgi:hypothetical protein
MSLRKERSLCNVFAIDICVCKLVHLCRMCQSPIPNSPADDFTVLQRNASTVRGEAGAQHGCLLDMF